MAKIDLPPAVVRAFVKDMRAYFAETNGHKQDEMAARQLHAYPTIRRARAANSLAMTQGKPAHAPGIRGLSRAGRSVPAYGRVRGSANASVGPKSRAI